MFCIFLPIICLKNYGILFSKRKWPHCLKFSVHQDFCVLCLCTHRLFTTVLAFCLKLIGMSKYTTVLIPGQEHLCVHAYMAGTAPWRVFKTTVISSNLIHLIGIVVDLEIVFHDKAVLLGKTLSPPSLPCKGLWVQFAPSCFNLVLHEMGRGELL